MSNKTATLQSTFSQSFREDIDTFWGLAGEEITKYKDQIFFIKEDSSDRYTALKRVGLRLPEQRNELEPVADQGPGEAFKTVLDPKGFSSRVSFSYEFTQRDMTDVVNDTLVEQRKVMEDACEYAAMSVFDSAGSAAIGEWGMSGGDAAGRASGEASSSLLNTAHASANGVATRSNTSSVYRPISTAAINSLIDRMANAKNYEGLPRARMAKAVIVPALRKTKAQQVTGADKVAESSDNTPNVMSMNGVQSVVANPYIKNKNFWGILTDVPKEKGLIFIDNIPLKRFEDFDTGFLAMHHIVFQAVAAGFIDWQCFYGWT